MSLINQMLQDLEKRRASAQERGPLPNQVRVLPQTEKSRHWMWFVIFGALVIAAAAWQWMAARGRAPTSETPAVADAGSAKYLGDAPVSRLALDIANVPPAKSAPAVRPPATNTLPAAVPAVPATKPAVEAANAPALPAAKPAVTAAAAIAPETVQAPAAKTALPAPDVKTPVPAPAQAVAKPRVIEVNAGTPAPAATTATQIDKRMQQLTPAQMAENEYREAANFLSQGRLAEAQDIFRQALTHNPAHIGARQGLFGLLVDAKRNAEAEQLLRDGLKLNPNQSGFAMALARMQLDRGDANGAIETLQGSAAGAQNSPDYLAFYAALLQRQSRHREAAEQYQAALKIAPQSGVWLMGMGISLQALGRNGEAQDAFRRAKASNSLSAELQAFVDQRLRQLQ
jgi:MSHA biogenesis protein MshN